MRAPLFSSPQAPHQWQRHLARAKQYRDATTRLTGCVNGEQNWPRWFLTAHAIELTIKAFIVFEIEAGAPKPDAAPPHNHDLIGQYEYALLYGLKPFPATASELAEISPFHRMQCARYPDPKAAPPALDSDDLADRLCREITAAISS
jgi:hypothetical protein